MNSFLILAGLCIGFPLQHLFQRLFLVPWRWVLSQEPCPHSTPDLPKTRYNRYKMSWASLGQADPLCQSGYCDKQSLRGSSCTQQSWLFTCATCTSQVDWGSAPWLLTQLNGADISSNTASHQSRRKEPRRGPHAAIKCPDMTWVTFTHNSLAKINHQAAPNHKRAKKCNPSMCSAGA